MKRLSLSLLSLILLLAACVPVAPSPAVPGQTESAAASTAVPPTDTPAVAEGTGITVTDALGREVVLPAAPRRIIITGRALFMIADAAYLFPGAAEKIVGLGDASQGSRNFIQLIDPNYAQKQTLDRDAGAEQIAALQPDLVLLKS